MKSLAIPSCWRRCFGTSQVVDSPILSASRLVVVGVMPCSNFGRGRITHAATPKHRVDRVNSASTYPKSAASSLMGLACCKFSEHAFRHRWLRVFPVGASGREIRVLPPRTAYRSRPMPGYRCNMLDQRGDVLFPADIVAEDLASALRHAFDVLRQSNQGTPSSKQVYALEVWADEGKLFTRELGALADAMGITRR